MTRPIPLLRRMFLLAIAGLMVAAAPARPPPPPRADLAGLVGQYDAGQRVLDIAEYDGALRASVTVDGKPADVARPLRKAGPGLFILAAETGASSRLRFRRASPTAAAAAVEQDGRVEPRVDVGAQVLAKVRAMVKGNHSAIRAAALKAAPPAETRPRAAELVALRRVDPTIRLDIRYATANNFMGFALYERADAFMQRPAALALARASAVLRRQGYGLLIHDAYRPWFVTKMFWESVPPEGKIFVADPSQGSRHNRGCAVDLTLYDLKTGKAVEMPGRYDEMSARSYADYPGGTTRQRWLRSLLRRAMEAEGFTVYPQEWWHFDYKDWDQYPIGNVSFERLDLQRAGRGDPPDRGPSASRVGKRRTPKVTA